MKKTRLQTPNLKFRSLIFRAQLICLPVLLFSSIFVFNKALAQNSATVKPLPPTPFRIGERLTYNIGFEKFKNAAYAEIYVVSRGKIGDKDVVELQSKIRTTEFMSAAFYLLDETRTTYASAETGLPLYVRKTSNAGVLPTETVSNFLITPTVNFDWLTMIYRARNAGGVGNFPLQEDDKFYTVSIQAAGAGEKVKTDAGEFETNISTVQSEFLVEKGITNFRINFSADDSRTPVLIRFKTAKGAFRAEVAGIQMLEPEAVVETTPTPAQRPQVTPRPVTTPTPYINNQQLSADLPFKLGETFEYQISTGGRTLGTVVLQVKERKQVGMDDCLVLSAVVTGAQPGQSILNLNDVITAHVNPDTLVPYQITMKFGRNAGYNQITQFDQKAGSAIWNGTEKTDIPIGTHSLLSLAYAIRSFNLKPSKDPNNPVNDTRVAVFLRTGASVFVLRPSNADLINLKGEKVSAQLVSITTGVPEIDALSIRLWLSTDERRVPLRLTLGAYQADLVSEKQIPLK
jgi:hypothetical protein